MNRRPITGRALYQNRRSIYRAIKSEMVFRLYVLCTFSAESFGRQLQRVQRLCADVLQGDGQLLGLSIKQLQGHASGQVFTRQMSRPGPRQKTQRLKSLNVHWGCK